MAVTLTTPQLGHVSSTLELTGNFLPRRRTVVVAEVDGVIRSIPRSAKKIEVEINGRFYSENLGLDLGQFVSQGDILVELDPTEYELELAAAQSRRNKIQKDLEHLLSWRRPEEIRRLKAAEEDARARLALAESNFQRAESLIGQRATSGQEHEQAVADLRSSRAAVERAEAELAEALAGPTEEEIAVAKAVLEQAEVEVRIKEDRLKRTVIRAPYDAYIVERFVDEGERVTSQPRVELMELVDLSFIIVQVGVPERYLGRMRISDRVQVAAAGNIDPVPGVVILVNEKVDQETRTFRVRVAIENEAKQFMAGQFAKVAFEIDSAPSVLVIPTAAVVHSGGQPRVFVYNSQTERVSERMIRLGLMGHDVVEVTEGLSPGEQIVLRDPAVLADQMRVEPVDHREHANLPGNESERTVGIMGGSQR